ncbi:hypothetical protein OXX79_002824 [Metschnikowia pulcherrima]
MRFIDRFKPGKSAFVSSEAGPIPKRSKSKRGSKKRFFFGCKKSEAPSLSRVASRSSSKRKKSLKKNVRNINPSSEEEEPLARKTSITRAANGASGTLSRSASRKKGGSMKRNSSGHGPIRNANGKQPNNSANVETPLPKEETAAENTGPGYPSPSSEPVRDSGMSANGSGSDTSDETSVDVPEHQHQQPKDNKGYLNAIAEKLVSAQQSSSLSDSEYEDYQDYEDYEDLQDSVRLQNAAAKLSRKSSIVSVHYSSCSGTNVVSANDNTSLKSLNSLVQDLDGLASVYGTDPADLGLDDNITIKSHKSVRNGSTRIEHFSVSRKPSVKPSKKVSVAQGDAIVEKETEAEPEAATLENEPPREYNFSFVFEDTEFEDILESINLEEPEPYAPEMNGAVGDETPVAPRVSIESVLSDIQESISDAPKAPAPKGPNPSASKAPEASNAPEAPEASNTGGPQFEPFDWDAFDNPPEPDARECFMSLLHRMREAKRRFAKRTKDHMEYLRRRHSNDRFRDMEGSDGTGFRIPDHENIFGNWVPLAGRDGLNYGYAGVKDPPRRPWEHRPPKQTHSASSSSSDSSISPGALWFKLGLSADRDCVSVRRDFVAKTDFSVLRELQAQLKYSFTLMAYLPDALLWRKYERARSGDTSIPLSDSSTDNYPDDVGLNVTPHKQLQPPKKAKQYKEIESHLETLMSQCHGQLHDMGHGVDLAASSRINTLLQDTFKCIHRNYAVVANRSATDLICHLRDIWNNDSACFNSLKNVLTEIGRFLELSTQVEASKGTLKQARAQSAHVSQALDAIRANLGLLDLSLLHLRKESDDYVENMAQIADAATRNRDEAAKVYESFAKMTQSNMHSLEAQATAKAQLELAKEIAGFTKHKELFGPFVFDKAIDFIRKSHAAMSEVQDSLEAKMGSLQKRLDSECRKLKRNNK